MLLLLLAAFQSSFAFFDELFTPPSRSKSNKTYPKLNDLDPIILVPGLAGSRLEYINQSMSDWKTLWIDAAKVTNYKEWIAQLSVKYDADKETYESADGIAIRPADYGGVGGIDYLEPNMPLVSGYFATLIKALKETGYTVGKNLFGAPYDWRLSTPHTISTLNITSNLKALVELAYGLNNRKVHLLGHSMGTAVIYEFLTRHVTPEWKEKYIASYIPTSPPLGGSFEALAHLISPHAWNAIPVPASIIHPLALGIAGIHWMLPNKNAFGDDRHIVTLNVSGQVTNITMKNITYPFTISNRTSLQKTVEHIFRDVNHFEPPNVPVHVIYSNGRDTAASLTYTCKTLEECWENDTMEVNGDGDGTVPIESLKAALGWKGQQSQSVKETVIPKESHMNILKTTTFCDAVIADIARNV